MLSPVLVVVLAVSCLRMVSLDCFERSCNAFFSPSRRGWASSSTFCLCLSRIASSKSLGRRAVLNSVQCVARAGVIYIGFTNH